MLPERYTLGWPTFPQIVNLLYRKFDFAITPVAPLYPQLPAYSEIRVDNFIEMRYCIYIWT